MLLVTKTFVAGATSKLSSKPKPVAAKISTKVADGIENCTFGRAALAACVLPMIVG